jgi:hypothetical protein
LSPSDILAFRHLLSIMPAQSQLGLKLSLLLLLAC